jgi:BirA family biotin operon repressor/biotin-[acetyl-CoA-carboxylase] ligase
MEKNQLNESKIRELAGDIGFDIHVRKTVGSTNDILKKLAAEGAPHGLMLMAQEQTAGRGRLGRSFFSPKSGIYLSFLLRPQTPPQQTLFFTTSSAVAVCRAIERVTELKAQIKWVNDVYIGGRKVCGILTESAIANGVTEWAVVGIGVNITPPEGGFPDEIANRACALFEDEAPEGFANRFAAALAEELWAVLSEPHAVTAAEYRARSLVIGMEVTACDGGREERCTVLDVDDSAALLVRLADGREKRLCSGEVSIKL